MVAALEAEQAHEAANPGSESPLTDLAYNQLDLARFTPNPTDEAIRDRLEGWHHRAADDLRRRLAMDDFYTLLAFARRAAVRSLRDDDPQWAKAAAQGLSLIAADRIDQRDLAWATAVVAWQLQRVSEQARSTLLAAAEAADAGAAVILREFTHNPPANLRDEWGLDLIDTPKGVGLSQVDYSAPYHPSADLVAAAVSLADAIDGHGYLADNITVATDLPDVWLRGAHHEQASLALERVLGCVSISGDPRPETGAAPMTQMLTAWIVELANDADAHLVAEAAASAASH